MGCLTIIAIVGGISLFLLMEHALVFWIAFVPLVILFIVSMIRFVRQRSGFGLSDLAVVIFVIFLILALLVFVAI